MHMYLPHPCQDNWLSVFQRVNSHMLKCVITTNFSGKNSYTYSYAKMYMRLWETEPNPQKSLLESPLLIKYVLSYVSLVTCFQSCMPNYLPENT